MPKSVPCPVCHDQVKVPRDAAPGDRLTCPGCTEVFTPPHLKTAEPEPLPDGSESYGFEEAEEDTTALREKKRKVSAIQRAARELERTREEESARPTGPSGTDTVLLVFSTAVGAAGLVGYLAAGRVPSVGEVILLAVVYGGFFLFLGWRKFKGSGTRG